MLKRMMMLLLVMGMGLALLAGCGASNAPVDGIQDEPVGGDGGSLLDPVETPDTDTDTDAGADEDAEGEEEAPATTE